MSYKLINETGEQYWVALSGKLTIQDFQELQALGRLSLELYGRFRILVELQDFEGWSREPGWEQTTFLTEEGAQVSRIAFVGDAKWRDDVFLFTGKPLRTTEMEFFPPERIDAARVWLAKE